jgi:hypothetical protein
MKLLMSHPEVPTINADVSEHAASNFTADFFEALFDRRKACSFRDFVPTTRTVIPSQTVLTHLSREVTP